ncbi:MAG: aminoacyl-tRNA hydrolase [Clostridia bacterium]
MKLIVGLGNPGNEYTNTKHNLGYMFLDYVANKNNFNIHKNECNALTYTTNIANKKVIFAKPTTYMNLSGESVCKIKEYYKIDNDDILVIFDDVDIPFNDIRFRSSGSGGTHNGMKNIIDILKSDKIARIKIGIGNLKNENQDLSNFVLSKFSKEEILILQDVFDKCYTKLLNFIDN